MSPVVPTASIRQALEQVPDTPPDPDGEPHYGWVMDEELIRRWQEFGPLRDGVHEMAAHALADVTEAMVDGPVCADLPPRVLLLAGPGGNGADGLRAGRVLARRGRQVDVMVLVPGDRGYSGDFPDGSGNQRLLAELLEAGGRVITGHNVIREDINHTHGILLEALVGSGFEGHLTGLMASWAQISGWVPSIAVDVPAGIEADTGHQPQQHGNHGAYESEHRSPPTVTVALGALRPAHTTAHCGTVLLARCGLEVEHEWNRFFVRLLEPEPGFAVPETVDTLFHDGGMPVASRWADVQRHSVCVVASGIDCLGFGLLALQALRGAGAWHRLSLVAREETAAGLVAQHPEIDVHPGPASAAASAVPPEAWVAETRDVDTLTEVLSRGEKVVLGPRAIDALARADRLDLVRGREGETTVITRRADFNDLGTAAEIVQLTDHLVHTHRPSNLEPGQAALDHHDPVVPLGRVQGIEAVLAGVCAVTVDHMALAFLADRMRRLRPHWPVPASALTRP
ncbi:NAD(P)H-hydrate epimerase [Corynebacterium halotolerans]|nr:NAD(P)H-hydrate epimerase [Corynebacterium halotolerans]